MYSLPHILVFCAVISGVFRTQLCDPIQTTKDEDIVQKTQCKPLEKCNFYNQFKGQHITGILREAIDNEIKCQACGLGTAEDRKAQAEMRQPCKTVSGDDPNVSCAFPFKFNGTIYNNCALATDGYWCSTRVDNLGFHVEGQKKWGHCGPTCPFPDTAISEDVPAAANTHILPASVNCPVEDLDDYDDLEFNNRTVIDPLERTRASCVGYLKIVHASKTALFDYKHIRLGGAKKEYPYLNSGFRILKRNVIIHVDASDCCWELYERSTFKGAKQSVDPGGKIYTEFKPSSAKQVICKSYDY